MLTARDITKSFPDHNGGGENVVLERVSLEIEPGKLTALIGPSGSGKTTLLKCLAMLDVPDNGEIHLDEDMHVFPLPRGMSLSPKPWPKVTAVFQQLFLWPHLTLRQNILLPVPNGKNIDQHLEELIDLFDMGSFIDRYPNETSGGQKQRAAIARALILDPSYVLLDEITSALDVEQTVKVLSCLETLKERNIGVLLITHHINFAKRACDRVAFMDNRKIIEIGAPKILDKPKDLRFMAFLEAAELAS